jgi:hypothetical protein
MPNDSLTAWGPIDIHAHFYPQAYLDVLEKRIADMDAQGTAAQAMSLTGPRAHRGDEEVSHKLSRAWNDHCVFCKSLR